MWKENNWSGTNLRIKVCFSKIPGQISLFSKKQTTVNKVRYILVTWVLKWNTFLWELNLTVFRIHEILIEILRPVAALQIRCQSGSCSFCQTFEMQITKFFCFLSLKVVGNEKGGRWVRRLAKVRRSFLTVAINVCSLLMLSSSFL
jgi:hypothetical protein